MEPNFRFLRYCTFGDLDKLVDCYRRYNRIILADSSTIRKGFIEACINGHMAIVQFILAQDIGSDVVESGIFAACEHGHLNIVAHVYGSAKFSFMVNWSRAAYIAAKGGHRVILNLLDINTSSTSDGACEGGHVELFNELSEKIIEHITWNDMYYRAHRSGHTDMIKFVMSKSSAFDPRRGVVGSCEGGHLDTLKDAIERCSDIQLSNVDWIYAFRCAAYAGHTDVVRYLREQHLNEIGLNDFVVDGNAKINLDIVKLMPELDNEQKYNILTSAYINSQLDIITYLFEHMELTAAEWQRLLELACRVSVELVTITIAAMAEYADDLDIDTCFSISCEAHRIDVIKYWIDDGLEECQELQPIHVGLLLDCGMTFEQFSVLQLAAETEVEYLRFEKFHDKCCGVLAQLFPSVIAGEIAAYFEYANMR